MQVLINEGQTQVQLQGHWSIVTTPEVRGMMLVTIINNGYDSECVKAQLLGLKNEMPHKRVTGSKAGMVYEHDTGARYLKPNPTWGTEVSLGSVATGEAVQIFVKVAGKKPAHVKIRMVGLSI